MSAIRTHRERRSSGTIELPALAGSERWAACDEARSRSPSAPGTHEVHSALRGRGGAAERLSSRPWLGAKDGQLAKTMRSSNLHRPREPTKCILHFVGEEEQRNDRALGLGWERKMGSLRRRRAACFYCVFSHSATACGMLIPRASVLDMALASCGLSPKPSSIVILAAPIVDCTQSLYPPASRLSVSDME